MEGVDLSVIFGDDSDRFIVPDDRPINWPLNLSWLQWYTTQNTTHRALLRTNYVHLESLCFNPTVLEMNWDARESKMEPPFPKIISTTLV